MSDFIQHLQANYSNLRKSEKIIADYLQLHAQERLDFSITELARRLKVSETTGSSRFCRVIGLRGYQALLGSGRNTARSALGGEFPICTLSVRAVGS